MAVCAYSFLLPGFPACTSVELPLTLVVSLLGLLTLHLLTAALYMVATILSSRGTLLHPQPRAKVVVVAYILLLVSAVELAWLVFSTYSAVDAHLSINATLFSAGGMASGAAMPTGGVVSGSGEVEMNTTADGDVGGSGAVFMEESGCGSYESAVTLFSVLVCTAWLVYSAILIGLLVFLDPCGCCLGSALINRIAKVRKYHDSDYSSAAERSLTDFNRFDSVRGLHGNSVKFSHLRTKLRETFCCCLRRDGLKTSGRDAFSDVTKVLRMIFSDVDATFSDLLAGFLLASLYQHKLKDAKKNRELELTKVCVGQMSISLWSTFSLVVIGDGETAQGEALCP